MSKVVAGPVEILNLGDDRRGEPHPKLRFAGDSPVEGSGFEPSVPGDKPWVPSWKMVTVLQVPPGQAVPQYDAAGMLGSALS